MARKEIKHNNTELKSVMNGYANYNDLTEEARILLKEAISSSVPVTSQKSISTKDIFFLIRTLDEISTENVSFWMNLRKSKSRNGKPLSSSSIKIYKRAVVEAAVSILSAHQSGVDVINWKVQDNHYLNEEQATRLTNMKNNKRSIEEMLSFLQSII